MIGMPTDSELEEVHGDKALSWVKKLNLETQLRLEAHPEFHYAHQVALRILETKEKIPYGRKVNDVVYNFWQDDTHKRGIWRRTTPEEYEKEHPNWEVLLDIDELNHREGESWVFSGVKRLLPDADRVLVGLSRGGKDATVYREFDMNSRTFVKDGFFLPEAQTDVSWLDRNTLLVGTNWGDGSVTQSGYPRELKVLKRGQKLEEAQSQAECHLDHLGIFGFRDVRVESETIGYTVVKDFFHSEHYILQPGEDGFYKHVKLPIPEKAEVAAYFHGQALIQLKTDWVVDDKTYPTGAVVALELESLNQEKLNVQSVFEPTGTMSSPSVVTGKNKIYINVLDNVNSVLYQGEFKDKTWKVNKLDEFKGTLSIYSADDLIDDEIWMNYQDFLTPSSLMAYQPGKPLRPLKQAPSWFDTDDLTVDQFFATSKDGTQIPYFVVHKKDMDYDGENPTWLNAYGGFEVSETPFYSGVMGKLWLEKGGVFVLANIRGGGEFGPSWHQAGLKENRQCVYDDFAAVSRDLIDRKITNPEKLAAQGGSNGGLLMGVALTQHPELYNAIVCEVPLLDMLRYHKLLKGHSWVGEYGDPDDPKMRPVLESYSPLHNLHADETYPEVLFCTSTEDDRVHPGHARKMAKKMAEYGHKFAYFENIEGGHSAAADLKQRAYRSALVNCYLREKIWPASLKKDHYPDMQFLAEGLRNLVLMGYDTARSKSAKSSTEQEESHKKEKMKM